MNLRDLVPRAARVRPGAVAVADLTGALTYAELDDRAAEVAAALAARGLGRGDRVVLWGQKSAELVAVMQAVLRLGAVYVPVSPMNPPDRVRRIAADCAAALLVTDRPDDLPVGPRPSRPPG
ncbi:hypothetical protein Asp14428_17370 [Actinoplanes sp. NBRC 14428]|nr:hypothetical protein Asp14428_17370 [Actinoplanes sp. NBRC 14428]